MYDSNTGLTRDLSNADSPTTREDGSIVFAKPFQEDQPFQEFLDYVVQQETDPDSLAPDSEVRYAQTRKISPTRTASLHDCPDMPRQRTTTSATSTCPSRRTCRETSPSPG